MLTRTTLPPLISYSFSAAFWLWVVSRLLQVGNNISRDILHLRIDDYWVLRNRFFKDSTTYHYGERGVRQDQSTLFP